MYSYYLMNNLPSRIITTLMLYNSHTLADIIKESTIFDSMRVMNNIENGYIITRSTIYIPGGFKTAYECGILDGIYKPRKRIHSNNTFNDTYDLTKEERREYALAYLHYPHCWEHHYISRFSIDGIVANWYVKVMLYVFLLNQT